MPSRRSFEAVVLRLRPDVAERLRMAGARDNRSLEEVLEDLTEQNYSRDGKATTADASKGSRMNPLDSPTIKSDSTRKEISRLLDVAKTMR